MALLYHIDRKSNLAALFFFLYTAFMKQKTANTNSATKGDLQQLERRFEKKFATKTDLKNEIGALETRIDIKFERFEQKIDDKAQKYRDEVLTKMDGVTKELETIREEQIVANRHIDFAINKLVNHEKRLTKIETHTP